MTEANPGERQTGHHALAWGLILDHNDALEIWPESGFIRASSYT